jgi:ureidoglycolate lyase
MPPAERILRPKPLTAEGFAPFGDVIEPDSATEVVEINRGYATRYDDLTEVVAREGRAGLSLFRARPLPQPIQIRLMERHPKGSQAFVPLGGGGFVVVVAPQGALDPARIEAFLARNGQGVNFAPGTWHHFLITLAPQDFLVIDRLGSGENCDVVELSAEQMWTLEL